MEAGGTATGATATRAWRALGHLRLGGSCHTSRFSPGATPGISGILGNTWANSGTEDREASSQ